MSLTKLYLAGKIKLFPARESLVSDIPAGDRKIVNIFLQCTIFFRRAGTRAPVRRAGPGTAVSSGWRQSARTGSTTIKVGSSESDEVSLFGSGSSFELPKHLQRGHFFWGGRGGGAFSPSWIWIRNQKIFRVDPDLFRIRSFAGFLYLFNEILL
jgi:hypothetical protein